MHLAVATQGAIQESWSFSSQGSTHLASSQDYAFFKAI